METALWRGTEYLMQTNMKPSLRQVMVARKTATPPATTAPTNACVATRTWCLCWRSMKLGAALMERLSTIPQVSAGTGEGSKQKISWWSIRSHLIDLCVSVPCCPENVAVSAVSTDTLEITWTASLGAELYETTAADALEVILCNDTAPVCALSDLSCDRAYSVVVTPCNDISGCNRACKAHTKDTGEVSFKLQLEFAVGKHPCQAKIDLTNI